MTNKTRFYNDRRCPVCANKYELRGNFRCRLKDDFWLNCRFVHEAKQRIVERREKIKRMLEDNRKDKEELRDYYNQLKKERKDE